MRQSVSPSTNVPDAAPSSGAADTQLRGRSLIAARVIWVAVAVTVVALNILALPGTYPLPMPPDILRDLHRLGISPTVFIIIYVLENAGYTLVYLTMGILIFWRRSDDRMALFCSLMLITFGGVAANSLDDIIGGSSPLPPSLVSFPLTIPLVHLLVVVGQVSFVTFFYLFPSGHFVPRWTRWCALLVVAYWVTMVIFPALENGPVGLLLLVFFVTALVAQVYRYRRVSTPTEREQAKWVLFGFAAAVAIIVVPALIQPLLPATITDGVNTSPVLQNFAGSRFEIGLALVPIFIAIAITRSRLWAIDTLINRTLVYGSLTTILAALYFACVIGAQTVSQLLTHQTKEPSPVVIVASTLLIAALFQPSRRRIQDTIDRRFYRRKYDAARTVAAFSATLRQEIDLDDLRAQLLAVVDETIQPAHVSLWLRPSERNDRPRTVQ
ncbi:MAG: hypothetical protein ACXWQR_11430 [Ktedonobacterales bacterium]